jgi:hypothetical protein
VLDTIAVTRAGVLPRSRRLLVGQPNVFERLYGASCSSRAASLGTAQQRSPAAIVLPPQIGSFDPRARLQTHGRPRREAVLRRHLRRQRPHVRLVPPGENNFTLDPAFIAQMAANNPFDPLFLAEFDPNLDSNQNGGLDVRAAAS